MIRESRDGAKLAQLSCLIYTETDERLRRLSKRLRVSLGFVVRLALDKGLDAIAAPKPGDGKEKS